MHSYIKNLVSAVNEIVAAIKQPAWAFKWYAAT